MDILDFFGICGWIGSILIIFAYFRVSGVTKTKWSGGDLKYQITNVSGAILIAVNVGYKEVWGVLFLQITWAIIGIVSIVNITRKKR